MTVHWVTVEISARWTRVTLTRAFMAPVGESSNSSSQADGAHVAVYCMEDSYT